MRGGRFPKKRRALPGKEQKKTEITTPKQSKRVVRISEGVTVGDLARNMGVKAGDVIKKLMDMGVMSTMNQMLDVDTATLIAGEFGYNVENVTFDVESAIDSDAGEIVGEATPRPPVVTVMGHVDHGKTSLLDAIRHTNVTDKEYGGITQHIGAYTVEVKGRTITFVDTPGHEAFTAMRARGAKITDIVILVVGADEGVMPQTIEALNHARAAGVPIVVAINKIDRPEANVERVKQQLTQHSLISEDYGGDTIVVPVSARTREGIDKLLEMILLQAEVLELKANAQRNARGVVIESQLDRGRGPVATVLIQEGTLHQGDPFVCGIAYGRVRAMLNHLGEKLDEAGPAIPVEIFGLSEVPEPGTSFLAVNEESKARQVAEFRASKQREGELTKSSRVSLEDLSQRMKAGEVKELKVIIKGDVQGSVEALSDALRRLSTDEVKLEILHSSAGAVSETDVTLAAASRGIVIGFNVRADPKANALAEKEGVEIRLYTIIYDAINDMREAMEGLLAPTYRERTLGRAEVRQTFTIPGATIAGSMVVDGKITRSARARLVRDGRVAWEGKIGSLRRFKDDAREVASGYECGIGLENFNDVKPDDVIETFEMEAVLRKLSAPTAPAARVGQAAV
ncbi:MAG TPA: translation initiation factor IF-2, partial [Candidatus Binataceae bacterium]|jgi:translation initiation factor IF-2